ncbi:penicillin-binding protein PBP4 [Staphylococcus sp. NRL 21/187]|nr:penicillin-binding protein PBP4 [Staphylococcus sp. NRL 21/187]MCJ1655374.1 penicillin-binding protein PBP4 [Staphylococcus sp. NRL 21/187]
MGSIGFIALLSSTSAHATETPVNISNQLHPHEVSSIYQPDGVTLTTQQGQVLYDYQGNKKVDPASLSKMMTLYLTYEAIDNGKLKLSDTIKVTKKFNHLSNMPNLSSVPLRQGQTYTIEELIKQTALASSNAAAIILGEKVSGNTSTFTDKMNQQAKIFNMDNSHFINPAGAQNNLLGEFTPSKYKKQDYPTSTAKDMTILAHELIAQHPELLKVTQLSQDTQKGNTFTSTNLSLKHQPLYLRGTDGLKTGTSDKGYNITLTNNLNHLRLNETVMNVKPYGNDNAKYNRNKIGNHIIQYYRQQYEYKKVLSKGKHTIGDHTYEVKKDLYDTVPKDSKKWTIKVNKNNQAFVSYKRDFLPNTSYPKVVVEKKWKLF